MLFQSSQIEIPKKNFLTKSKKIPIGMIGSIFVELKRTVFGDLVISTPYADFEVEEETPGGVIQKLEQVIKYFVDRHPELLFVRHTR